jgi:nucleotide-binding universal stress UspA family protein
MGCYHQILVALDGSPDAEQALTEAIDLAEREHARLTLITAVTQLPAIASMTAGEEFGRAVEGAHADADAIVRRARERVPDGISVTAVLSEQPIRIALCRQIADGHHDLVDRATLNQLAQAHGYDTAFWWTSGIAVGGAVVTGALLRGGLLADPATVAPVKATSVIQSVAPSSRSASSTIGPSGPRT